MSFQYNTILFCPILDPDHGFDLVPFYVGAIALALLIIGCIGVCVNYRHYKNADRPNRVHTIKEKEMNDISKRESTSGIFSYSEYFFEINISIVDVCIFSKSVNFILIIECST